MPVAAAQSSFPTFDEWIKQSGLAQPDPEMEKSLEESREKIKKTTAAIDSDSFKLPPTPQHTDPLDTFGSAAGWLAVFGSLLTKQPLQSALSSSAAAMNAVQKKDAMANKEAIEKWKENNQIILDRAKYELEAYKAAQNDAQFQLYAKSFGNQPAQVFGRLGQYKDYIKAYEKQLGDFEKAHEKATSHPKVTGESFPQNPINLSQMRDDEIVPGTHFTAGAVKGAAELYNMNDTAGAFRMLGRLSKGEAEIARAAIANEAARLRGDKSSMSDVVETGATIKADSHSLMNLQKQADAAASFEETAKKNFDTALELAPKSVPDLNPYINEWIEKGETAYTGNPNVPAYVAALLTGANEYAKIMSGSTGAQGSTVDSRKEAAAMFSPYLNTGQIKAVVDVAKKDMNNRMTSYKERVDLIKDRIKNEGKSDKKEENPEELKATHRWNPETGQLEEIK